MNDTNEFEKIMLKKLTHSGEYFGKVLPILKSEFFADVGNQELFKLIQLYYSEYHNIPSLTELVASVKNVPNAEIRTEIINSLKAISITEEVQNIEFICNETVQWVKDAMYLQALMLGSDGLMKKDDSLKLKAQQIMDERSKVSIDTDLGLDFDSIQEMIDYYSTRNIGIRTQHKQLNKRLGAGFLPGTLSIILAAASVGKSLLMTDLVSGIFTQNKNILLVSLEMQDKELMKRVHANAMDLPINSLIDLSKNTQELKRISEERSIITKDDVQAAYNRVKSSGTCGKFFVKDYPAGMFTSLMLEQLIESYKIEKNVKFDLVFVDYLGIMKSDLISPSAGLYSYIKSIGEELRAVAKKANVAIISASQLNRQVVGNIDTADNSNISDSLGTAMVADMMLFLLQNDELKEKNEMVCKITKNRFTGITDTWIMNIDYTRMRFKDALIQGSTELSEISNPLDFSGKSELDEDISIISAETQQNAEQFAQQEVKDIYSEDIEKLKKESKDPFKGDDLDDMFKELGID